MEMTKYSLSQPGSDQLFFLSERICQDPLENYFGQQCSRGGRCDNPSIHESLRSAVAIRAQHSLKLDLVKGNCRTKRHLFDSEADTINNSQLLKCRRNKNT